MYVGGVAKAAMWTKTGCCMITVPSTYCLGVSSDFVHVVLADHMFCVFLLCMKVAAFAAVPP